MCRRRRCAATPDRAREGQRKQGTAMVVMGREITSVHALDYRIEQLPIREHPETHLTDVLDRLSELGKEGWCVASVDLTHHPSGSPGRPAGHAAARAHGEAEGRPPGPWSTASSACRSRTSRGPPLGAPGAAHRAGQSRMERGKRRPDPPSVVLAGSAAEHAAAGPVAARGLSRARTT